MIQKSIIWFEKIQFIYSSNGLLCYSIILAFL